MTNDQRPMTNEVCLAKKKDNPKISTSPMDMDLLEHMTRLMKENDLNTVDVRDGDKRVILKRGAPIAPGGSSGFAPHYAPVAHSAPGPLSGTPITPAHATEAP